eukprot:g233.t1
MLLGCEDFESSSPQSKKSKDVFQKKIKQDVFDDIAEAFEQQAKIQNRALNLYDSDDLTGFKKPINHFTTAEKAKEISKPIMPHSSIARARQLSPRSHLKKSAAKGPQTEYAMKLYNLRAEEKRTLLRAMEAVRPSDLLNVLSDEENDECPVECQRVCRYPLPTMPLAIMVPYLRMPVEIFPLDPGAVTEKLAEYDDKIEELMQIRNRLSSCFELFDDLCNSFRGPQNLDCFLRSMISCNSFRSSKKDQQPSNDVIVRPQSCMKQTKKELFSSVPPEKHSKNEDSTDFSGSRLLRPTISTRMKHIDVRNKEFATDAVDLPTRQNVTSKRREETRTKGAAKVRSCSKKSRRSRSSRAATASAVPPSEEDAREDMLLRVRRHLMRMPWMGGRSKKHFCNKQDAY